MPSMISSHSLLSALAALTVAYFLWPETSRLLTVLGTFRTIRQSHVDSDIVFIEDTTHCEDIHYYEPAHTLFAACEDDPAPRFHWFPPVAHLNMSGPSKDNRGSIHVIDPYTHKSQRLEFTNFKGAFITHGIDVIADPDRPDGEAVYIFAVNHLHNPAFLSSGKGAKARSQIELFHHVIGSTTIEHVRSIWHPLIRTPNDVYARSPKSLYITNDHYYAEGGMRSIEDLWHYATWTDTVHIDIDDFKPAGGDATAGIKVKIALDKMHNNNGLGHGRTETEMLITSCAGGVFRTMETTLDPANTTVWETDVIPLDSTIDNPSYFRDPYATAEVDKSGYVIPGLSYAMSFLHTAGDPVATESGLVWLLRRNNGETGTPGRWTKRLLFEDDGSRLRGCSAAVLVAIDPKLENGQRKAWLYATSLTSSRAIAVKVDL